ncbi:MAG TPA: zinc-dependent alcohol dehydrogenase family protein [Syntrophorhabdaceae bacterium]|nr:zinc-dependent alcohol dehydrogenase family protein [Syntrophorhabdaceae bacterium]
MRAMILNGVRRLPGDKKPLSFVELPVPVPNDDEVLIKVSACGVCHTELDEIEGRTPPSLYPIIPGHQIIGNIVQTGKNVTRLHIGDRVGIGWIFSACGECSFCIKGDDNLCEKFKATGRDAHGGYAEYTKINERFAFKIPDIFTDSEAAPLLCAGAIGYRSLRLANLQDGENLGLIGFGASAHLVLKMAQFKYPNSKIFVFARSHGERAFAMELGAFWAGDIESEPPERLNSAIDTTPVWKPIMEGMKRLEKGGRMVINAIRKEDIDRDMLLSLDYVEHLWLEKEMKSVANVASNDIVEFLELASAIPIKPEIQEYDLQDANTAIIELKERKIRGAKVLKI